MDCVSGHTAGPREDHSTHTPWEPSHEGAQPHQALCGYRHTPPTTCTPINPATDTGYSCPSTQLPFLKGLESRELKGSRLCQGSGVS